MKFAEYESEFDELTRPLLGGQQQTLGQHPESIIDIPPAHATVSGTTPLTPGRIAPAASDGFEVVKSIVYGGLDTTLISLGVVASSTGADAKTSKSQQPLMMRLCAIHSNGAALSQENSESRDVKICDLLFTDFRTQSSKLTQSKFKLELYASTEYRLCITLSHSLRLKGRY